MVSDSDHITKYLNLTMEDGRLIRPWQCLTSLGFGFFADSSLHGWDGIFGGTKKILGAVKQRVQGATGS
jgi:hypothetical protein